MKTFWLMICIASLVQANYVGIKDYEFGNISSSGTDTILIDTIFNRSFKIEKGEYKRTYDYAIKSYKIDWKTFVDKPSFTATISFENAAFYKSSSSPYSPEGNETFKCTSSISSECEQIALEEGLDSFKVYAHNGTTQLLDTTIYIPYRLTPPSEHVIWGQYGKGDDSIAISNVIQDKYEFPSYLRLIDTLGNRYFTDDYRNEGAMLVFDSTYRFVDGTTGFRVSSSDSFYVDRCSNKMLIYGSHTLRELYLDASGNLTDSTIIEIPSEYYDFKFIPLVLPDGGILYGNVYFDGLFWYQYSDCHNSKAMPSGRPYLFYGAPVAYVENGKYVENGLRDVLSEINGANSEGVFFEDKDKTLYWTSGTKKIAIVSDSTFTLVDNPTPGKYPICMIKNSQALFVSNLDGVHKYSNNAWEKVIQQPVHNMKLDSVGIIWAVDTAYDRLFSIKNNEITEKQFLAPDGWELPLELGLKDLHIGHDGIVFMYVEDLLFRWNGKVWEEQYPYLWDIPSEKSVPFMCNNGDFVIRTSRSADVFGIIKHVNDYIGDIDNIITNISTTPNADMDIIMRNNSLSLSLPVPATVTVEIFNVRGQIIASHTKSCLAGVTTIPLTAVISPGLYIAKIKTPEGEQSQRFTISK